MRFSARKLASTLSILQFFFFFVNKRRESFLPTDNDIRYLFFLQKGLTSKRFGINLLFCEERKTRIGVKERIIGTGSTTKNFLFELFCNTGYW